MSCEISPAKWPRGPSHQSMSEARRRSDTSLLRTEIGLPERERPRPGEFSGSPLMNVALFVHEAVVGLVAEELGIFPRSLEAGLECIDRLRRAPVVSRCEVSLQRYFDIGSLGDRVRRQPIE